jgi:hypothetical protein
MIAPPHPPVRGDAPLLQTKETMSLFKNHKNYESDHTKFINELKQKTPGMEERQQQGRALLWDKSPLSLDEQRRIEESRIRQQAYVYQHKL